MWEVGAESRPPDRKKDVDGGVIILTAFSLNSPTSVCPLTLSLAYTIHDTHLYQRLINLFSVDY